MCLFLAKKDKKNRIQPFYARLIFKLLSKFIPKKGSNINF